MRVKKRGKKTAWVISLIFRFQTNRSETAELKDLLAVDAILSQGCSVNSGLCLHTTFSCSIHSSWNPLQVQRGQSLSCLPTHSSLSKGFHTQETSEISLPDWEVPLLHDPWPPHQTLDMTLPSSCSLASNWNTKERLQMASAAASQRKAETFLTHARSLLPPKDASAPSEFKFQWVRT